MRRRAGMGAIARRVNAVAPSQPSVISPATTTQRQVSQRAVVLRWPPAAADESPGRAGARSWRRAESGRPALRPHCERRPRGRRAIARDRRGA